MMNVSWLWKGSEIGLASALLRTLFLSTLFFVMTASAQVPVKVTSLQSFRDCPYCPEMIVLPSGSFLMGANKETSIKAGIPNYDISVAVPQHSVSVKAFAIAKFDVTRGEFAKFVQETGYSLSGCKIFDGTSWGVRQEASWRDPGFGFEQTDQHPVVCVSFDDARMYVWWLNDKLMSQAPKGSLSEIRYRLPSEAEWEYAARAGTQTLRFWGDDAADQCKFANGRDLTAMAHHTNPDPNAANCFDKFATTSPVGAFRPNQWGLYDMLGNVYQWTEDCWHYNYSGAPTDGQAWISGNCTQRVVRGGSWATIPRGLISNDRLGFDSGIRQSLSGFCLARDTK